MKIIAISFVLPLLCALKFWPFLKNLRGGEKMHFRKSNAIFFNSCQDFSITLSIHTAANMKGSVAAFCYKTERFC